MNVEYAPRIRDRKYTGLRRVEYIFDVLSVLRQLTDHVKYAIGVFRDCLEKKIASLACKVSSVQCESLLCLNYGWQAQRALNVRIANTQHGEGQYFSTPIALRELLP